MHKILLTFDTEDFISVGSIPGLRRLLEILKKNDLTAMFFISGHMAEKLSDFPNLLELLDSHLIGYHSSSHSVHPTLFEFTDVESYEEALKISIHRETAHINPLSGEIEGKGGIHALRDIFPGKDIEAFRAPGHCWTPPHLEALKTLGMSYDFSTNISLTPVNFKEITFYPYPLIGHWHGKFSEYFQLFASLRHGFSVLTIHPSLMVNFAEWDSIYNEVNPKQLNQPQMLGPEETDLQFMEFNLLLRRLRRLQKIGVIEVTSKLEGTKKTLCSNGFDINKCYLTSMRWANRHKYKPKYLQQHFTKFFESL